MEETEKSGEMLRVDRKRLGNTQKPGQSCGNAVESSGMLQNDGRSRSPSKAGKTGK